MASLPLEGVRVVELATGMAGPVAGLLLGECGAEVVKVEPKGGDPARSSAGFATWNRSKRSVTLDLENAAARDRLNGLLAEADIVLHDLPPSKAGALGLDDCALAARFPQLIVCSVLAFPAGHRDAERPADEFLVQARGMMDEQPGYRDGPIAVRFPGANWAAAHLAAAGIVTRLIMRLEAGRGGSVHTSLVQGMLTILSLLWCRAEKSAEMLHAFVPPVVKPLPRDVPQGTMYLCQDSVRVQIMNPGDRIDLGALPLTREVLSELGLEGSTDPEVLHRAFAARSSEAWLDALHAGDVAVEPVTRLGEALRHPEAAVNQYVVDVDDPVWGKVRQAAVPIHLTPAVAVRGPAPKPGAHQGAPWVGTRRDVSRIGAERKPRKDGAHPLSGLKVLDFGAYLAGPMAPSMLGDLGAEVIKVEPLTGDRMRFMASFFEACSRNKRSIALDLTKPEGQEVLGRLVRWADIAHHNVRMRAAKKLGIDEAALRRHNPSIIYGYASAYGQKGERGDWPGFDTIFQALAGWEVENAGQDNPPQMSRLGTLDAMCALNSLYGTLIALYQHRLTGTGTSAESSLLGVACLTQSETMLLQDGTLAPYPRLDHDQMGTGPYHRIYQAADGWIAVAALKPGEPEALCKALDVATADAISDAMLKRSCTDVLARLDAAKVPAEQVMTDAMAHFFADEANKKTKLVTAYAHPVYGRLEMQGAYWMFGDKPLALERTSPLLGQHTREIMVELGYGADEIEALQKKTIIAIPS